MQINLQGKDLKLTPAIEDYVLKRITNLEKLLSKIEKRGGEIRVNFEVGRNTKHHKSGLIFQADVHININGEEFYGSAVADDLYKAVDAVKEILFNDIEKNKDRKQTLFKRGASSVKKMLKGLSDRNPFTSKY